MPRRQCTAPTQAGPRCRADALPGEDLCFTHSPRVKVERADARRRGGQAKSNAARAAKMWAAVGREIPDENLPALLKAAMLDVRAGKIEPAVATALATLAKAAVSITADIDLERRIDALEQEAGLSSGPIRRVK